MSDESFTLAEGAGPRVSRGRIAVPEWPPEPPPLHATREALAVPAVGSVWWHKKTYRLYRVIGYGRMRLPGALWIDAVTCRACRGGEMFTRCIRSWIQSFAPWDGDDA